MLFTEHKDGMLEIVATPVMLVGQSGGAASLVDVRNLNGNLILYSVHCFSTSSYTFYKAFSYFSIMRHFSLFFK